MIILTKNKYPITIAIGDPHATPGVSNERFEALGNLIAELQPDNIAQMGDFTTLDSISFHNLKSLVMREGMRLSDDIEAAKDAYDKMMAGIIKYNSSRTRIKKKHYKPNKYWLNGNHEDRAWRYIQDKPELQGFVPATDFVGAEEDGWELVPYRKKIQIEGTYFTHIPMNRRINQPISGEYVCKRAALMHNKSVVFGHTHRYGIADDKKEGGQLVQGINIGWFGDHVPHYVEGNEGTCDWWDGVVVLTHIGDGQVITSPLDMKTLKRDYL